MTRVLVTGDKGYVGSNLVEFLEFQGYVVDGYDIQRCSSQNIVFGHALEDELKGCDYVFNCAAVSGVKQCKQNPFWAFATNLVGAWNVVRYAEYWNTKPVLFSSRAIYGSSYYGECKKLMEECFKDKAVILRPSNVYGGKNYREMKSNNFLNTVLRDDPVQVWGGEQTRDFVHISTVLDWCLRAMELPCGIYDVCSGVEWRIEDLAWLFATARGVPVEYWPPRE